MEHTWMTILGLAGLLGLAVLMLPAANKLKIPHTVLLAAVGVLVGIFSMAADPGRLGILGDFLVGWKSFEITSDAVLFIFLPALLFGSALTIDVHRLIDDIGPILLLAVIGLLLSTFIVGYTLWAVSGTTLLVCLLLGAIVSATDPVAVMAIFKDLQAPKRLTILVEGESLFNDAAAIVMFSLLSAMLAGDASIGVFSGIFTFLKVFVGGVVVGYVCAWVFCWIISGLGNQPLVKTTLTISLAYLSFIFAEHYLHVSGVMAVVTAALGVASFGRGAFSTGNWENLTVTWEQIDFWANSIIFVLVGMVVPTILVDAGAREFGFLAVLVVVSFAARAGFIYGLLPLVSLRHLAAKVNTGFKTVMFWGGLRGAVSLALALAVMDSEVYSPETKGFIGMLVTGFVLFTLLVNATTIGWVMKMFRLDELSPVDLAVRNRATVLSLTHICEKIDTAAREHLFEQGLSSEVLKHYHSRVEDTKNKLKNLQGISEDDWVCIGLADLCGQERKAYLQHFAGGYVSSVIVRRLLANVDDIADGLKAGGVEGYRSAYRRVLGFSWRFRLALTLHRRFGYSKLLGLRLADRFEILLSCKTIVRDVLLHGFPKVTPLIGEGAGAKLLSLIEDRINAIEKELTVLKLQYPEYSGKLQERYLGRVAIRLEDSEYQEMYEDSVISQEVFNNLEKELESHADEFIRRPELDIGLTPEKLVEKVSYFSNLSPERIGQIARLLKPRLAIPGEILVHKGDPADAMYFISSGCIEVELEDNPAHLGTGDFFGEIGLMKDLPRTANVIAHGYCELLVLFAPDFLTLLDGNPELAETIRSVAQERLEKDGLL